VHAGGRFAAERPALLNEESSRKQGTSVRSREGSAMLMTKLRYCSEPARGFLEILGSVCALVTPAFLMFIVAVVAFALVLFGGDTALAFRVLRGTP